MKIFSPCWKDIAFYFGGMFGVSSEKKNQTLKSESIILGGLIFKISLSADKNRGLCEELQTIQIYFVLE